MSDPEREKLLAQARAVGGEKAAGEMERGFQLEERLSDLLEAIYVTHVKDAAGMPPAVAHMAFLEALAEAIGITACITWSNILKRDSDADRMEAKALVMASTMARLDVAYRAKDKSSETKRTCNTAGPVADLIKAAANRGGGK